MAGNRDKFIDRSPIICPAGKPTSGTGSVASILRQYTIPDAVTAYLHCTDVRKEDEFKPPRVEPPFLHNDFKATAEISHALGPPVQTRYQTVLQDLKETSQDSYWNKELGKVRDPVPGLPIGMDPVGTTFGTSSVKESSVKELVNPPKTPYEVLYDSQVGHDLYKRTHNDYNPSEQVNRNYYSPPYNPTRCFGKKTKFDPRGIWVHCCCDWHFKEPVVLTSKIQADQNDKVKFPLGKSLTPNKNIECVPKGHVFGKPSTRVLYGVAELLKDNSYQPCLFKRDFYRWLSYLNKCRTVMRERVRRGFIFDDVYKRALYFDKEKEGFLPLKLFSDLCSCNDVDIRFYDCIPLLEYLEIITKDHRINYKRFLNLINSNVEMLELKKLEDIPRESLQFITTNQTATCDYLIIDNSGSPAAGVPTIRTDLPRPVTYPGTCRADLESLGDYTSVKALINPSIYTSYGLNYRDFFQPRSAETLRRLFENVGYSFAGDLFDRIWDEGLRRDGNGGVCVDTFRNLLKVHIPSPRIAVDELECDKNRV